jgi:hypothetical protein
VKKLLKQILEDGEKADKRLADIGKLVDANRDRDFTGPMPAWRAELKRSSRRKVHDGRTSTEEAHPIRDR